MITREQVADLRPGDVVEMSWPSQNDPDVTVTMRGTLRSPTGGGSLCLGCTGIYARRTNGEPVYGDLRTLTVVSRAPRLYVNSDRTEPVPGDVARDADSSERWPLWVRQSTQWGRLRLENSIIWRSDADLPARLRLLVDGTNGQPVTS